jgi:hypothetical protein
VESEEQQQQKNTLEDADASSTFSILLLKENYNQKRCT